MKLKNSFVVHLCLVLLMTGGWAVAQDEQTVYTQVGMWDVPRERWGDFVAYFEQNEKPVMERLVSEGLLVEWGIEANGLHDPDGYSHVTWFSAHSLAALEKTLEAYYESLGSQGPQLEAEFAGLVQKHKDMVVRSRFYGSRSAKLDGGYSFGTSIRVKRGQGPEFRRAWESWSKPVYERLLSDGVIVAYTLDEAYHHTDEDSLGRMWTWYVIENIEDQEKVDDAFDALFEGMSETEREGRWSHYWSMIVEGSHRDGFGRLVHFQTK